MPHFRFGWTRIAVCVVLACIGTSVGVASGADKTSTPTPVPVPPSLSPAITEIEADWVRGKIKLRAEVVPRGAEVVKVTFRYRGKRFVASKVGQWKYAKKVTPRGGDSRGDTITYRVKACTATKCASRKGSDEAGG